MSDRSRKLAGLALAVLIAMALPAARATAAQPGINIADPSTASVDGALATGAKLVRTFVRWDDLEPAGPGQYPEHGAGPAFDAAIRRIADAGARPLFVVQGAPSWANGASDPYVPPDPAKFADFFARFVAHTRAVGPVAAYEVWNEEDEVHFWHGGVNPPAYAEMLRQAYAKAKPLAGDAAILLGPMTGNNYAYLQDLYAAGAKGYFDGVTVHTDTACLVAPPDAFYRDPTGAIGQYTFLGYRSVHDVLVAHGDDKPIWMTELGWSSTGGRPDSCANGMSAGRKADGVTEAQQAANLTQAYGCLASYPYVKAALWFTYSDAAGNVPEEHNHYGLVTTAGAPKPSYPAFRAVVASGGGSPQPCGDFKAPALRVLAPAARASFGATLLIRARADDHAGAGLRHIVFRIGGRKHPLHVFDAPLKAGRVVALRWRGAGNLRPGRHTVTVTAVDVNGNKTTRHVIVCRRSAPSGRLRTVPNRCA